MKLRLALFIAIAYVFLSATARAEIRYSSIPDQLPGNVPSVGFEATSTAEFGDEIGFIAKGDNNLSKAKVVMSSWGCENGNWFAGNCQTTPGLTFQVPITLTLYAVDNSSSTPTTGAVLARMTRVFKIKYRPSASAKCGDGRWYSDHDHTCYNGYAQVIEFDLNPLHLKNLPDQVIWSVAYDTTHYGYAPLGEDEPCYTSNGGCGYDSMNVGVETFPKLVGTDVDPNGVFQNSLWGGEYCDGGAGGTGTFRLDTGCWADYRPLIRLEH